MKIKFYTTLLLLISAIMASSQEKSLWQTYYIMPRNGFQHVELSHNWKLNHLESSIKSTSELPDDNWVMVSEPTGVQMALYKAGELPEPYVGLNSLQYEWTEQSVWYYKKNITLPAFENSFVFLCFDGVDYFSRLWVNGQYVGNHEGMFGGPVAEISRLIKPGENEIVLEVKSANYSSLKDETEPDVPKGKIIKPWEFTGGLGAEPWYSLGMWRGARIEIVPEINLARPFLSTVGISGNIAKLQFQTELFANDHSLNHQFHPWDIEGWRGAFKYSKVNFKPVNKNVEILISLKTGSEEFTESFPVALTEETNWVNHEFEINNPRLWWPNGMGEATLYDVSVQLFVNNKKVDEIKFDYGIRKIDHIRNEGPQFDEVWNNWQFVVNGKKFFVKGINWMPADVLLNLEEQEYEWLIKLAKDAGIQMFRVWGAGLIENNEFYDLCNKNGIMVWQDFTISGTTREWPVDVWEAQVAQNIFRLRNHPSLVLYNGGNEFNAYGFGNSQSIGVLERNVKILDPTRMFTRTSPDGGSVHTYPDMDPVWYNRIYRYAPFIAETGMHSITDPKGLRRIIREEELKDLGNMYSEEFAEGHPEFIQHFVEFNPGRVPRMLSRASHIDDMANPVLESLAEATQIGAGEFYQILSEKVQSNYPVTTGLLPWVFKRPWPVVSAIHLIDGFGQPSAPYYFLKKTYEPVHVMLDIERLFWAPGDTIKLVGKVLNLTSSKGMKGMISIKLYDDKFDIVYEKSRAVETQKAPSVNQFDLGEFVIPGKYTDRYFFANVELADDYGNIISRSVYWPRSLSLMQDSDFREEYLSKPMAWPTLEKGPWLKPTVAETKTNLQTSVTKPEITKDGYMNVILNLENKGNVPAFMVHVNISGSDQRFYSTDNNFWLSPGENKKVGVTIDLQGNNPDGCVLEIGAWNSKVQCQQLKLK